MRQILISFFVLLMVSSPVIAGTPHIVAGKIFNHDASVPADGSITFNAYITSRPSEVQTQNSVGSGYSSGYWYIGAGNFATAWNVGDVVHVDFTNTVTIRTGSIDYTLTATDPDMAPDVTLNDDLTINNSAGVTLSGPMTVNGTLTFLLGNLIIGNNNLTLGSTATVSGAADGKCVVTNGTGVVSRAIATGDNFTFPVGTSARYNPVIITNNDVAVQTYTVAVVVGENPATTGDAYACNRTWNITKTGTSTANVTFTWNSADKGGSCDPSISTAWRHNGTAWINMGGLTTPGTPNTTTLTNVASFSSWTIGNSGSLPVEMTSFTAVLQGTSALLKWSTATEVNNYGFEIERRQTANWENVDFVAGAGTSNSPRNYSYTDNNLSPGRYMYRIKQVDNNGTFSYYGSAEVEIGLAAKKFELESNYPNPFNPSTTIQFILGDDGLTSLQVYNILGQKVMTLFDGNAQAGRLYQVKFDASSLPSGLYVAKLESGKQQMMRKMVLMK